MLLGGEDFGGAGLEVEVADEATADVVAEDEDRGIGDVVIDLGALFTSADDAGTCEDHAGRAKRSVWAHADACRGRSADPG